MNYRKRLERLRVLMEEAGLDGLLVSAPVDDVLGRHSANRRYLTGFTGSAGTVLVTREAAYLAVDPRYWQQAGEECDPAAITIVPVRGPERAWLRDLLGSARLHGKRLGLSPHDTTLAAFERLREAIDALPANERPRLVTAPPLVERLRRVKDAEERRRIARAAAIADEALRDVLTLVEPGRTELELARAVEAAILRRGGEGVAFSTIVAAGPWGALPHAYPREVPLTEGASLVIDMGAYVEGYCSDLTRTVPVGSASERFSFLYEAVREAQLAALETVAPGVRATEPYRAAREALERRGLAEFFTHGLGHGVGLEVHEGPYLGPHSDDVLEPGMVFTIEPGVYLPDWGGIRLEDLVFLGEDGPELLSRAEKLHLPRASDASLAKGE